MSKNPPAVRLAHFSDIHITAPRLGWQTGDWFTKRLPGWLNYRFLGRRHRFRMADQILTALVAEFRHRRLKHLIFSGDATALGFEEEFANAAALLQVGELDGIPGLAVPGNHDYYTRSVAASGLFERYFAKWQVGERVDGAIYPFAQRLGPLWLIGLNTSTGNRWMWDASGGVDSPQLDRLARLLEKLGPGLRVLVTHYPVCMASGKRERRSHQLRNVADVVRVAQQGGICLWLHGHRHDCYRIARPPSASFPIICAGSATQYGLWSYGEYTIEGNNLHGVRRIFSESESRFQDRESFDLELEC
jgi:3',5'-cyclic AMP phosphodiesterase CpdA